MIFHSGSGQKQWMGGIVLTSLLLATAPAFAIFPPVTPQSPIVPTAGPNPTPLPTPAANDPPVVIGGTPVPGPVVDPPVVDPPTHTVSTPEPATLVMGLISVAFGAFFLRRKANPVMTIG